jgi:hypothetical protein
LTTSDRMNEAPIPMTQAEADDLFRASEYLEDLDDYYYDEDMHLHMYVLLDGLVVAVDVGSVEVVFTPEG